MGCSGNYHYLWLILAQLLTVLLTTDGSITWYEPLPIQTVTNRGVTHKPNNTKLREGSINASLSWNFSLSSDVTFSSLTISFNTNPIAAARSNGQYGIVPGSGFEGKFGFRWISSQRATLIIFDVTTAETGGLYVCEVVEDKGLVTTTWSSEVQVDVVVPPRITFITGNQTKNESDTVTLICNATGVPQPTIRWTRSPDQGVVTFTITGEQDKGVYTCTADNGAGNPDSKDVYISVVNFHPEDTNLSTNLSGMIVLVNTSFSLICSARANPPAKYRLYRGQESLLNTTVGQNSVTYTTNVIERIRQVNYSCTPFNFYGDGLTQIVFVTVHYRPSSTKFSTTPSNTTVPRGSSVTLNCIADANPDPHDYWFHFNDSYLGNSSSGSIRAIVKNDGVYTCVPVNIVGVGVSAAISVTAVDAPSVQINATTTTVVEGNNITLYCNASGKPKPAIRWTKVGSSEVLSNTSALVVVNVSRPGTPDNLIQYQCTASNGVGSPTTATANVTVYYPPTVLSFTTIPGNTTVLRGSTVTLNCSADAFPETHDYQFYSEDEFVGNSSSGFFNVTVSKDGGYTCVPINRVDAGHNATITVTAVDAPSTQINATTSTVVEGNNIALYCNASGKPKAAIRWTEVGSSEVLSNTSALVVVNVSRPGTPDNKIQYQCTASNGVGGPATATANVTVYYPPNITQPRSGEQWTVNVKKSTNRTCVADASPEAAIVWKNSSGILIEDGDTLTFQNATDNDTGHYTCVAANVLGSVDLTLQLSVTRMLQIVSVSTTLEEDSNLVTFKEEFERQALLACGNLCADVRVLYLSGKGSVIIIFEVNFTTPVTRSKGLAGLKNAVNNGTLGPFTVRDFKFLEGFDPPTTPTTLPKETTAKSKDDKGSLPWPLIGGVAGGVVFLCFVIGGVTWGVHSRRKCKKDAKIAHDPGSEEQRLQRDDPYAQVNNGYAETGPRSVNSREKAAAVPDYAVVDKSAKKKKKKQDEEKLPEYATVDKSKKKKKNEKVDDTYAKVDMSKKTSKKKPRSGEDMLYADLGDFSGASQMPTVATSPKAQPQLPPIKRPEPYEGTQYADITQFLKGDATLPIDGKQGTELKEKDEKTDKAGGENAPKETPM